MSTITRPRSVTAVPVVGSTRSSCGSDWPRSSRDSPSWACCSRSWKPYGKDARADYWALRQSVRAYEADRIVCRVIAAAGGG